MQVSVETTSNLGRRMTVQVPAEQVTQQVNDKLTQLAHTVKLDGFRPGKVPMSVVQKRFGEQAQEEVASNLITETYEKALQQENLQPAGTPTIEKKTTGDVFEYTAAFEVYPNIELPDVSQLEIDKPSAEITDDDLEAMLDKLRKQRVSWSEVERSSAVGDRLTIDFEGEIDGETFNGNSAKNVPLELGSGAMIPGFEDQLVGVSSGDERSINVTFPNDYGANELAGKEAVFQINVHSVSEAVLPELNDEFAVSFGIQEGGIEQLRSEVRGNMERELAAAVKTNMKKQVFDSLLKSVSIDIPSALLESEIDVLVKKGQEGADNMTEDDRANFEDEAKRRVSLGLLIGEMAKANQLQMDPEKIRVSIDEIAASYEKPEEVKQWYYGNQEMMAGIQALVMEDTVVEWVSEQAKTNDITMSFNDLLNP
ncbi:MAG: trigger factor [Gammaproteobacteria bacterium]